ncbi:MAG: peptidoglycan-associated lipoprotein [Paracoccaceae bacterium]|nr:MAG: peptidoglycan-associated lipoprotein Pal [Alphaproteobacteria bacterium]GIX13986.1 MAG: peptidoglycan-associated lipoprotein [Paracoccaceae bacterium]
MIHRASSLLLAALALAACSGAPDDRTAPVATPAPGTAAIPADSVQYFNTIIGDRVFFAFDSSALDAIAQDTLRRQAEWLIANPAVTAVIEGHADERGTRDYNLALGARRANAVFQFLVGQGVEPTRLRTVSYGKERPEALCSNESCWSQNRRAVTVLAGAPLS